MSKKKLKAGIGALLAALMMLSSTSCGLIIVNDLSGEAGKQDEETVSASEEKTPDSRKNYKKYVNPENGLTLSKQYLAELPERDYEGAVFFITTPNAHYISPADTESSVSRLAIERTATVEERLNVSVITSLETTDNMLSGMKQAAAADSYYTDLLMIPIYQVGQFRKDGTLINLRTLPFFDLEQPYFYQESSDMTSGGYSTYGVAGEASVSPDSFSAVFMNKDLLAASGIDTDSIYDLAEDGKWTWDELLRCSEAVKNLSDSGEAGRQFYTVTVQSASSRLPDLIFKSSGWDFIRTGSRKTPVIGYRANTVKPTLDQIAKIYNDPRAILDGSAGAVGCFTKGESAFLIDYLNVMPYITDASADWGVLPLPKKDEGGEYRTLISNSELVFGVPVNHTNGEFAAIVLSALNAASCGYIYDEYVDYSMLHVLRDNDSVNMLDMILDTASFDFALAFGNAYPKIADATYKLIRQTAKFNDLETYFQDRMVAANSVMAEEFDLRT
ncbi:MAG: extracellular solute-binding protein [Clostridia bacterium]|nr:extracellular solute-binding protein [Clostridia bacterium]